MPITVAADLAAPDRTDERLAFPLLLRMRQRREWAAGSRGARVVALERFLRDTFEHLLGEGAQQSPGNLECFKDGAILVGTLVDEFGLELLEELEIEVIL